MSRLNLVPSVHSSNGMGTPGRKETGSTISSSPPDDGEDIISAQQMGHIEHSQMGSNRGSSPDSTGSGKHQNASAGTKGFARPPGLNAGLPSPIVKAGGHSKNSSATSPLLTLTPNSSVDGQSNSDWAGAGKHASPFHGDVPNLPFLNSGHRRTASGTQQDEAGSHGGGISSSALNSFDLVDHENDNDGLLGLEALRDRAQSSPGPMIRSFSTSPPIARGLIPAHGGAMPVGYPQEQHPLPQQQHQHDRPRSVSRDRPPLSQSSYAEGGSSHHGDQRGDRGVVTAGFGISSSRGGQEVVVSSSEFFGAIARPELRQGAAEFDPQHSRRRASSTDNFHQHAMQHQNHGAMYEQQAVSHKFGSLPTLRSHIQQQHVSHGQVEPNFSDIHKPRHVRSVSNPVLGGSQGSLHHHLPSGAPESRYYVSSSHSGHPLMNDVHYKQPRASNMSHQVVSASYDNSQYHQKRGSMPNVAVSPVYGGGPSSYPLMQRREVDFHVSPCSQSSGPVVGSADDLRLLSAAPSMISPGQSPRQVHYGTHNRQPSDGAPAMLSSSPMSVGSGAMRNQNPPQQILRHHSSGDDDLTHPLVGEHIEVPDHVGDEYSSSTFMFSQSPSHPLMRTSMHSSSLSHDQIHFLDPPRHPPTAGAALPLPKVVYSVKFKRTQRNFVLGPRINRDLKIGTYVKVEADRGEDLGIVVGKIPADKYNFSGRAAYTAGMGPPPGALGASDLKCIIRLATHDEVSLLSMKREEEEELLKICRGKVRQRGLPMNVVDAEYQFDRHKLTFFFEAEGRVDFRELVRDLFSMYKTRIWMQQLDKNTSTSAQAIIAPEPANLQMDFGTPIIAPPSEFADSLILNGLTGGDARSY